jgi:energy-coupling factor transporter ATP-binding protein EcfA2
VYRLTIETSEGTTEVAVKVLNTNPGRAVKKYEKAMQRELKVWLRLSKNQTIVPLLGTANVESPCPALVLQWMPFGTLHMYLKKQGTTTALAKAKLARGVADGLRYLHSEHVVHGDLHPGNVLIDGSGNPRLTDFGLATIVGDAEFQLNTTTANRSFNPQWRAPEVIGVDPEAELVRPNFKSDVYSFGGIMFFITSGDIPWKEKKNSTHIIIALSNKIAHARPDNISDDHWNLIQKCWSWNPDDRPDATDVVGCLAMKTTRHKKTIVLFGETGAGKSSLINLMAGETIANTSPDMKRCTMQWKEYSIHFYGESYTVVDTIGLDEPKLGIKGYLESVENAYRLIKELDTRGGIDLLLYCVRAGRVPPMLQSNYRLFHEFFCEKKVPIVLAITKLERERRMEDWWERNHSVFTKYEIQVAGHACVTAADRLDGRHRDLYEESRITIRNLVQEFIADGQKQSWMGEDNQSVSLMRKLKELLARNLGVTRKDPVPYLTKRCGISPGVAKQLANMIKQDVV